MAIQYAYYKACNKYPTPGYPDTRLYLIYYVGVKKGADAMINRFEPEGSPQCPDHVKAGWLYQESTGKFLTVEEFKKDPEKYREPMTIGSSADGGKPEATIGESFLRP